MNWGRGEMNWGEARGELGRGDGLERGCCVRVGNAGGGLYLAALLGGGLELHAVVLLVRFWGRVVGVEDDHDGTAVGD